MTLQFIYVLGQEPEEAPNIFNEENSQKADVLRRDSTSSSSSSSSSGSSGPSYFEGILVSIILLY